MADNIASCSKNSPNCPLVSLIHTEPDKDPISNY